MLVNICIFLLVLMVCKINMLNIFSLGINYDSKQYLKKSMQDVEEHN